MIARALAAVALACLCAGAALAAEPGADRAAREMLVMLRTPAVHFRPDGDYGGGYARPAGRDARKRIAEAIAAQYGLRIVDEWPMPALGVDCFVMQAPEAAAVARLADRVGRDARVESAQAMNVFRLLAHGDPLYPLQPAAREWRLDDVHRIATGRGVRVAEIDSGVDVAHPDLAGQVTEARDFVGDGAPAAEAHGTAVAGIIVARADDGEGIAGVAPNARLLALRACSERARTPRATCSSFTLAKAMQFALDRDAQVVNLSVGGPSDPLLGRLIDVALARGVAVVAAADPDAADGGFPASHAGVLAIAAEDGQDHTAAALRAPARDVPTTLPGARWGFVSGSSYAAAHVSGLVAVLLEISPNASPRQLRDALAPNAAAADAGHAMLRIDACTAVDRTAGGCRCACAGAADGKASLR